MAPVPRLVSERLIAKGIRTSSGCFEWQGERDRDGYGKIRLSLGGRRRAMVHRTSYEEFIGPIPLGLLVMHTCDNPPCFDPTHLRVGTYSDNINDAYRKGRKKGPKTRDFCIRGHDLRGKDVYHYLTPRGTPARACNICRRIRRSEKGISGADS